MHFMVATTTFVNNAIRPVVSDLDDNPIVEVRIQLLKLSSLQMLIFPSRSIPNSSIFGDNVS
jgi:hypothetical protein